MTFELFEGQSARSVCVGLAEDVHYVIDVLPFTGNIVLNDKVTILQCHFSRILDENACDNVEHSQEGQSYVEVIHAKGEHEARAEQPVRSHPPITSSSDGLIQRSQGRHQ